MTDEEILRRLAEIEGAEWNPYHFWSWGEKGYLPRGEWNLPAGLLWNPLTNKAQAFELLEKYRLDIYHDSAEGRSIWAAWEPTMNSRTAEDESLPRAICLAIIASMGERDGR